MEQTIFIMVIRYSINKRATRSVVVEVVPGRPGLFSLTEIHPLARIRLSARAPAALQHHARRRREPLKIPPGMIRPLPGERAETNGLFTTVLQDVDEHLAADPSDASHPCLSRDKKKSLAPEPPLNGLSGSLFIIFWKPLAPAEAYRPRITDRHLDTSCAKTGDLRRGWLERVISRKKKIKI